MCGKQTQVQAELRSMSDEGPPPAIARKKTLGRERVFLCTYGQSGPCPTRGQSSHAQTSTLPAWCGQEKEEGCQKSPEEAAGRSTGTSNSSPLCCSETGTPGGETRNCWQCTEGIVPAKLLLYIALGCEAAGPKKSLLPMGTLHIATKEFSTIQGYRGRNKVGRPCQLFPHSLCAMAGRGHPHKARHSRSSPGIRALEPIHTSSNASAQRLFRSSGS